MFQERDGFCSNGNDGGSRRDFHLRSIHGACTYRTQNGTSRVVVLGQLRYPIGRHTAAAFRRFFGPFVIRTIEYRRRHGVPEETAIRSVLRRKKVVRAQSVTIVLAGRRVRYNRRRTGQSSPFSGRVAVLGESVENHVFRKTRIVAAVGETLENHIRKRNATQRGKKRKK